jgi:outer membrane receptor protein involved in Fe transport
LPDGIADARAKYKAFLPRVSLKYEFEENSNIYASVAKGNKPGDFTAIPANISAASLATVIAQQAFVVKEERSWNYEIGYKGALLDNRLVLTSALFWIDWSNQSVTSGFPIQQQNGTFTTLARQVNAGKSRVRGFELDASVAASDFFDFRVGYSFNDAKIRDYVDETERDLRDTNGVINNPADTDPSGQVAGRQIPQVPKHQIILSGNFHMPIMNGDWEAFFRQDFTFESKRYENVQNLAFAGNSYLLNLRAGIENDTWSLTLFYNNALNDKTPTVVTRLFDFNRTLLIPDPVQTFAGQPLRLTFFRDFRVGAPRRPQFGLTAIYKF